MVSFGMLERGGELGRSFKFRIGYMQKRFRIGDRVVFTRDKHTTKPGPRAKNVFATPHGETYEYQVDKFWVVAEIQNDAEIVLQTRRGKRHSVQATDPRLRKASFWERLLHAGRFPLLSSKPLSEGSAAQSAPN